MSDDKKSEIEDLKDAARESADDLVHDLTELERNRVNDDDMVDRERVEKLSKAAEENKENI